MKLLTIRDSTHLTTDHYAEGADISKPSADPDMPRIPKGFSETACGRTISGLPLDQPLSHVTCSACKGSLAYEQAQQLQAMLDEG